MSNINSLFGWSNVKPVTKEKSSTFESLFKNIPSVNKILTAIDCSGSVMFTQGTSFDNKNFSEIYLEAVTVLYNTLNSIPHKCMFWANLAKILTQEEERMFKNSLVAQVPFGELVDTIGSGTEPIRILEHIDQTTTIIVTDGSIGNYQVQAIKDKINSCSCGPIFLIIVPHLHEHKALYQENVEMSAMDNINITIPQAFSTKLASVLVWNYHKKSFYMVPELTAPWIDRNMTFEQILSSKLPLVTESCLISKIEDSYKMFNLEEINVFIKDNVNGVETIIDKFLSYNIPGTIKQQGTPQQKNIYNNICTTLYNRCLAEFLKQTNSLTIDNDLPLLEKIKLSAKYELDKKNAEREFSKKYSEIFDKLSIDKTVGEITSIGSAKKLQTQYNVKNFQSMTQENKFSEMLPVLPVEECSICGDVTNVFYSVNFPVKLLLNLQTKCINTVQVKGKKNKMNTITLLKKEEFRKVLQEDTPRIHCLKFCNSCASITMKQAKDVRDPEYGITKLVPQNYTNNQVTNRLLILPFINTGNITDISNPNEPRLSFVRQIWRGLFSNFTNLPVAQDENLLTILMFLTSLANQDNAKIVYDNQLSFLRGGSNDRYPYTIGRLFKLSVTPLSSQIMTFITCMFPVVELCGASIIPESRKLLLFCLLDKKIWPLINAKNLKDKAFNHFKKMFNGIKNGTRDNILEGKFSVNDSIVNNILVSTDFDGFCENHGHIVNDCIGYYVQTRGLDIERIVNDENKFKNLLQSENILQIAQSLNIDENYLENTMTNINMSFETFKNILPQFVQELMENNDTGKIVLKYVNMS